MIIVNIVILYLKHITHTDTGLVGPKLSLNIGKTNYPLLPSSTFGNGGYDFICWYR